MDHLALIYYVLSFTTGCVSIGIALLIYTQYKKDVIRFYALFLSGLALILASLTVYQYGRLTGLETNRYLLGLAGTLDKAGILLFIFAAPLFFHRLMGREVTPRKRILFLLPGAGIAIMIVLNALLPDSPTLFIVPFLLLYGTIAYCLVLVAVSFRRLGNKTLKKALRGFFFVSLGFFPLIVFEILRERVPSLAVYDFLELFSLPTYFFVINALSIVLSIRYFNQPPYLAGSQLTEHFKNSFAITDREGEIISLLAKGESYNQIAETLFISYKTVDNHVRNIYQKTAVRNRVQLINLLQANRQA
jgi:DNA-binding CsgD family transcriptional regulator/tellurite resistance protein TehA-like permease